jgi:hypothetical protein
MTLSPGTRPAGAPEAGPRGDRQADARVLYIGGSGRSGSTLLERLIGHVRGFCPVGELVHLWRRGVSRNELCGCGAAFADCGFWQEVGTRAFGGWDAVDPREILALEAAVNRHRFIPLMMTPREWFSYHRKLASYRDVLRRLYQGIHHAGGGGVIIDSSKSAPYAFVLAGTTGVDLRMLHLVRDSRGVSHSWTRRVLRPEVVGTKSYMPRYHPGRAAIEWTIDNLLVHLLASRGTPYHFVRYETMAQRPRQSLREILAFAGPWLEGGQDLSFLGPSHAVLGTTHSVAGNPIRFQQGRVPLRTDERWKERMPVSDRILVSLLTRPLLRRYGYDGSLR